MKGLHVYVYNTQRERERRGWSNSVKEFNFLHPCPSDIKGYRALLTLLQRVKEDSLGLIT